MSNKLSRRDFLRMAAASSTVSGLALIGLRPVAAQADGTEYSLAMVDWSDPVQTAFEEVIIPQFVEENSGSSVTINWDQLGTIQRRDDHCFRLRCYARCLPGRGSMGATDGTAQLGGRAQRFHQRRRRMGLGGFPGRIAGGCDDSRQYRGGTLPSGLANALVQQGDAGGSGLRRSADDLG